MNKKKKAGEAGGGVLRAVVRGAAARQFADAHLDASNGFAAPHAPPRGIVDERGPLHNDVARYSGGVCLE
mgnify:CR=1 FL=1